MSQSCLELYRPGLTRQTYGERAFSFLKTLVSADLFAYGAYNSDSKAISLSFDQEHCGLSTAVPMFCQLMGKYKLYNWDPTTNEGRPFCRSDFFSVREFKNLDMYSEVYRPLDIDNHCAVHVPASTNEIIFFGIERKGHVDFTDEERFLLELGQPHLQNAYAVAVAAEGNGETESTPECFAQAGLTNREAEVLYWITEGKSNPEIASLLNLRLQTVKGYIASIFNKAGVDNRYSAMVWAAKERQQASLVSQGKQINYMRRVSLTYR